MVVKLFGGATQPVRPAPAAAAASGGPINNVAQADPYLDRQAARVEKRIDTFGDTTGRAIDMAGTKIRDAAEGGQSAIQARAARTGTYGSGQMAQQQAEAEYGTQRAIDQSAGDITLGREHDKDAFMLSATGTLAAPGTAARADRGLSLQQWEAGQANQRATDAQALARQMAVLQALNSVPQPEQYTYGVSGSPYVSQVGSGSAGLGGTGYRGVTAGQYGQAGL